MAPSLCIVTLTTLLLSAMMVLATGNQKPPPKEKLSDYSDADFERLLDQWEEDEEPLEPDELPEHLRPQPKINLDQMDMSNPEAILKMSKKGKSLMAFVTVAGSPSRQRTEELTGIWQMSLLNNHISVQRFVIDDNRAIFMFADGSRAWDGKDFLIQQDHVKEVSIENKQYPGHKYQKATVEPVDKAGKSKEEL